VTNFSGAQNRYSVECGGYSFYLINRVLQEIVMDKMDLPGIDAEKLRQLLKKDFEDCVTEVVEAIEAAKAGAIIDDSEEPVRMATGKLR